MTTSVNGGALVFPVGAGGVFFAALRAIPFRWEQIALAVIGAVLVGVGWAIPRRGHAPRSG